MRKVYKTYGNACRELNETGNSDQMIIFAGELMTRFQAAELRAHPNLLKQFDGQLVTQSHYQYLVQTKKMTGLIKKEQQKAEIAHRLTSIEPFQFFGLPFSIRQNILKNTFLKDSTIDIGRHNHTRNLIPIHKIFWSSQRLRAEALLVFIEQTTFAIYSLPGQQKLVAWLQGISFKILHGDIDSAIKNGLDAVRKLEFPHFHRFPYDLRHTKSDIELMNMAPDLQEVSLTWACRVRPETPRQDVEEDLETKYGIDGMLNLQRLKRVVLDGPVSESEEYGLNILAGWLKKKFEGRDRKVDVIVTESVVAGKYQFFT